MGPRLKKKMERKRELERGGRRGGEDGEEEERRRLKTQAHPNGWHLPSIVHVFLSVVLLVVQFMGQVNTVAASVSYQKSLGSHSAS